MSPPYLPPEIVDYAVDFLHGNPDTLKKCCLVSKSWIPRIRKHFFAEVEFYFEDRIMSWKEAFPDPSASPAHYVKSMTIGSSDALRAAGAEGGGWIRGFSHVVDLSISGQGTPGDERGISLVPLHGFSPAIRSICASSIIFPSSRISSFFLSFPLLEDLRVHGCFEVPPANGDGSDGLPTVLQPSTSPTFTGLLEFELEKGTRLIARRLSSMPGGIHFRELTLAWSTEKDLLLAMALVGECSHTLESLDITCNGAEPRSASLSLLKATRLKNLAFRVISERLDWITMELRTITHGHRDLQQISICVYLSSTGPRIRHTIGEETLGQWSELDHLLTQLWESHSIRPKIMCYSPRATEEAVSECVGLLLPTVTKRGIIAPAGRVWYKWWTL